MKIDDTHLCGWCKDQIKTDYTYYRTQIWRENKNKK